MTKGEGGLQAFGSRSIRFRLTLQFVAIFGLFFVIFSGFLYESFERSHQTEFDAALYNHAVDVAQGINLDLFGDLSLREDPLLEGEKMFPFIPAKALIQLVRLDGKVLARSSALGAAVLPLSPEAMSQVLKLGYYFQTLKLGGLASSLRHGSGIGPEAHEARHSGEEMYRMISYRLDRLPSLGLILQIAVPLNLLEQEQSGLLTFFLFAIPGILLMATLGGLYFSRRALAPVGAMIRTARAIGATRLSARLAVPEARDELRELALTMNQLLSRLQRAFENQERFIADASHQLKTPLAIMRGELDVFRSRERSSDEIRHFLTSASQEIEHLSRIVEDLLLLARVDAENVVLKVERTRIDEILLEVVSRLEFLAKTKGIALKIQLSEEQPASNFEIEADPDLLRSMIHNLVENAIKFSPQSSSVEIRLRDESASWIIAVADHGPGIEPEALPRIFNRFFRSEGGEKSAPGSGLGLSITNRIAQVHGGQIDVRSELGQGTEFRVILPKPRSETAQN